MPKYWGKQIFTHGRFPKVGQKQKSEKKKKEAKRRARTMVITMATYALQSRLGQLLVLNAVNPNVVFQDVHGNAIDN